MSNDQEDRMTEKRTTKTPAVRAQEAVDVLTRRLTKLRGKERDARDEVTALGKEISEVSARLEYAKASPDLATVQGGPADDEVAS